MDNTHQLNLSTEEYKLLIKMVAAGQFVLNAPHRPDAKDFDNEVFDFGQKLIEQSMEKGLDIDIDEIIYDTMDCIDEGFLITFAHHLATRDSLAKGYDPETLLDDPESSAYHLERHNHYAELFYLKGLDAIGVIGS